MKQSDFQLNIDDKNTDLYFIRHSNIEVALCNFGARLVSIKVPDKNNQLTNILFSFNHLKDFLNADNPYYGATIGRYANRIANGSFRLEDTNFNLPTNDGLHHLHGGVKGLHHRVWDVKINDETSVTFSCKSFDGEEGYPGNLDISVTYTTKASELEINYRATSDKKTIINLTNHAFFNLNGKHSGDILNHKLKINAQSYTPVNQALIPTGLIEAVQNSPFDFREIKEIGKHIQDNHPQLVAGKGYDHNFIIHKDNNFAATAIGDLSKIQMTVFTTEPGIQFYSGNFMKDSFYRHAFALETQHFPDSPNKSSFPSTELSENEVFKSTTILKFGVENS